jgi:hypothetical protein
MKKQIISLFSAMLLASAVSAQAPNAINYQAALRNSSGVPMASSSVPVRFSVRDLSATGTVLYQETNTVTTNAQGIMNAAIGTGTIVTGTWGSINWSNGDKYLEVEVDAGAGLVSIGTQQLLSVPYAQYAKGMQASNDAGYGLKSNATANLWWGFFEGGVYRGYLGSYSGKNEDVDFGTGAGNTLGSVNFVVAAVPKVTIDSIGRVGIGTRYPKTELNIIPASGSIINVGDQSGWTGISLANTSTGPNNIIANGGSYLSFLYTPTPTTALLSSNSKMLMDGSGNQFRPTSDNTMQLGALGARWTSVWAVNGTIQTSDERYKTNILPLNNGLNTIMRLKPISYSWKNENLRLGTGINYGFSAQELNETAPDLVIHGPSTIDKETGKYTAEYADAYGVKYAEFTPLLVKAIQEQQTLIEKLEKRIAELEKK